MGNLCLRFREGEAVQIGNATVTVYDARSGSARLAIAAPKEVPVRRLGRAGQAGAVRATPPACGYCDCSEVIPTSHGPRCGGCGSAVHGPSCGGE